MATEIETIIEQAKLALAQNKGLFDVRSEDIIDEFMELNIGDSKEMWKLLATLLNEIKPTDLISSDRKKIIFSFNSKKMGKKKTLSFALNDGYFLYLSLSSS